VVGINILSYHHSCQQVTVYNRDKDTVNLIKVPSKDKLVYMGCSNCESPQKKAWGWGVAQW
jgi:hypothetical protein